MCAVVSPVGLIELTLLSPFYSLEHRSNLLLRITQQAEAGSGLETRFAEGFGRCRGTGLRLPLALYSQEGRWNDSPCNQSLPSICKKAGQLSQGATEEDHGCRKVRVLLELGAGWSRPGGLPGEGRMQILQSPTASSLPWHT